ncbi:hypothetical protein [Shewanella algae]|uniref:hypothetical protein n=1 Tax=Shewanella algae TaxID=38313 RepID=UPI001AAE2EE0|nr:hypothetical protein [Shewanella algae]MBO2698136.1 hypothetical protein [Shewanella algae]
MKVFAMNECEWWVGESLESCIADYIEEYGDSDCLDEPYELTASNLDSLTFFVDEREEGGELLKRTFKEQLEVEIAQGGVFPRLFASTEY